MVQGFACHARGVEIQIASNTHVVARVRSKRTYDVDLRAVDGRLVVGCKCPARSYGLDVCKHAWAALLEVDRKGGLEALREKTGTLIVEPATLAEDHQQPADGRPPNLHVLNGVPTKKRRNKRTSDESNAVVDIEAPKEPKEPAKAKAKAKEETEQEAEKPKAKKLANGVEKAPKKEAATVKPSTPTMPTAPTTPTKTAKPIKKSKAAKAAKAIKAIKVVKVSAKKLSAKNNNKKTSKTKTATKKKNGG
jgi:hypothetical protein